MIETHRLTVFRAVVATGSVSGAATALGYTASAVSQQLAALQRETGLALVERQGRGIVATPAGRRLAEEAGEVLERLAELDAMVGDLRDGRIGRLVIGYVASAGTAWVPSVVATLAREFPELRLDLRLVELSRDRPYRPDLEIVVRGAMSRSGPEYDSTELLDEPYVAVLPQSHPRAADEEIDLADLADELWVDNDVTQGPCREVVLSACAARGFTPVFRVQAHDYPSAVGFVAAGVGLTVLPRLGVTGLPGGLPAGVRAVPIAEPAPRRQLLLMIRPAVRGHPAVRRAAALLSAAATVRAG